MAAGQGKRMQDPTLAKVLYPLGGEPLVGHVIKLSQQLTAERIVVIIGYGREAVAEYLVKHFPNVKTCVQEEQLGTGHAVQQAERQLQGFHGDVLVLSGDVPLLTLDTARALINKHREDNALATVLTVKMIDPYGYGRIVRSGTSSLAKIVEEKDASDDERKINEINSGIYVFDSDTLFDVLRRVDRKNAQGEYYLTDTFTLLIEQFGLGSVSLVTTDDSIEVSGVNTKDQLAALETEYYKRKKVNTELTPSAA